METQIKNEQNPEQIRKIVLNNQVGNYAENKWICGWTEQTDKTLKNWYLKTEKSEKQEQSKKTKIDKDYDWRAGLFKRNFWKVIPSDYLIKIRGKAKERDREGHKKRKRS